MDTTESYKDDQHQRFHAKVNGRSVEFPEQWVTARAILDRAGFEGEFCLAAINGEGGKVVQSFKDDDKVDLKKHHHFRATYCGSEVVS